MVHTSDEILLSKCGTDTIQKKEHISLTIEISLKFTIFNYGASEVEMLSFATSNSG